MKKIILLFILIINITGCSNVQVVYSNYGNIYSYDIDSEKVLYLTFDDGYPYDNTQQILNILNEKNIKATFFFEGGFMENSKYLIKEIDDSGHLIANHTYTHTNITNLTNDQIVNEFIKFEELYYEITNKELIKYFRPPEGKFTNDKLEFIESLGYKIFFWSVNYMDWDRKNELGKTYAFNYITQKSGNGDIILMHTLTNSNVLALPDILDFFIEEGFEFKLLDYLVRKRENIV